MKKLLCLAMPLCLTLFLAACAGKEGNTMADARSVTQTDLLHHNFNLTKINGKDYVTDRPPSMEFNEGFRVSGSMCNRFSGQAELADNVLTVRQMVSTKMLCVDPVLNQLETDFAAMMMEGARIRLENNELTLSRGDNSLTFVLRDYVN